MPVVTAAARYIVNIFSKFGLLIRKVLLCCFLIAILKSDGKYVPKLLDILIFGLLMVLVVFMRAVW